jgi:hypothetical protein
MPGAAWIDAGFVEGELLRQLLPGAIRIAVLVDPANATTREPVREKLSYVRALFVNHNMVVELVFEYVRRAAFPSRCSRFQSFFAWESLEMARAFRKEGQALYRVESSSIFRADQSWLTLGVQNALRASLVVWRTIRHPSVGNTPCPARPR